MHLIAITIGHTFGFFTLYSLLAFFHVTSFSLRRLDTDGAPVVLQFYLPLIVVLLLEISFRVWAERPGSAGLGSLYAFFPAICSGALGILITMIAKWAQRSFFNLELVPHSTSVSVFWLWISALNLTIAVLCWRLWPAPEARMSPF